MAYRVDFLAVPFSVESVQLEYQPPLVTYGFNRPQTFVHIARKPRVGVQLVLGVFQVDLPYMPFERFQAVEGVVPVVLEVEYVEVDIYPVAADGFDYPQVVLCRHGVFH